MPSTPPNRGTRSRSPTSSRSPSQRPSKRQRRSWSAVVEELALANGTEEDARRISQRQKQIDYGKNTIAYDRFSALWPRDERMRGHPMTPIAKQKCSKRSFAGQVTSWKKKVYEFVAKLDLAEQAANKAIEKPAAVKSDRIRAASEGEKRESTTTAETGLRTPASEENEKKSGCEVSGEKGEGLLGDMDDIQLDDHGNVVASCTTGAAKASSGVSEDEEEEEYSDMEDIELDDMGNVVTTSKTPPPSQSGDFAEKTRLENSPPSIFDVY